MSAGIGRIILPSNRVASEPIDISSTRGVLGSGILTGVSPGSKGILTSHASLSMLNTSIVHTLLEAQMRVFSRDIDYSLYKANIGAFDLLDIPPHESLIANFVSAICTTVSDNEGFVIQLEMLHQGLVDLFSRQEARKSQGIFKTLQHLGRIFWKIQIEANQQTIISKIKTEFRPAFIDAIRSTIRNECLTPNQLGVHQEECHDNILNSRFDGQLYSEDNCMGPRLKTLVFSETSSKQENYKSDLPRLFVYVHGFLGTSMDLRSYQSQVLK
jgi:hypothetical protein